MTHRELCRAAASWLLRRRNCYASAWEVGVATGGQYDAIGVTAPDPAADVVIRCREYDIARTVSTRKYEARIARKRGERAGPLFDGVMPPPSVYTQRRVAASGHARPRVEVVECKVSRSDWLADARAQKLRRYEPAASHAWLYVVDGVASSIEQFVADGLPDGWGVVQWDGRGVPTVLREAAWLRDVEPWEVVGVAAIMLRSLSWRGTGGGPMVAELATEGAAVAREAGR